MISMDPANSVCHQLIGPDYKVYASPMPNRRAEGHNAHRNRGHVSQWIGRRGDRKTARARHGEILAGIKELLSRMEQMPGKPEDEQRRIVEKAKAMPIVMELSAGRPIVGDLNVAIRKNPKSDSRDT